MSAAAMSFVWERSPFKGVSFTLHLTVADSVNDQNGNRFWMAPTELAAKARTTRETSSRWLWGEAIDTGMLEVLVDNRGSRDPRTGNPRPSEFRFLTGDAPVVYEPAWRARARDDRSRGPRDDRSRPPRGRRDDRSRGDVTTDHAANRETAGGEGVPRDDRSPDINKELTQGLGTQEEYRNGLLRDTPPGASLAAVAPPDPAGFSAWWAAYPRHRERAAAAVAYQTLRRARVPAADLLAAAEHYAAHVERDGIEEAFIKHGATFLHRDRWRDYLDGIPDPPVRPADRRSARWADPSLDEDIAAAAAAVDRDRDVIEVESWEDEHRVG